ncbi:glycosyl hydrolase [Mycoplasma mycoides subsp. capri]|uniref:glycoside hydrolase family 38 N-terminal domain-containing protein n=1 Tax=Mycoplasma mycoides TaxID=2102 RepID=UPI00223F34B4|nr:glycosyl hydrolase-related protein [Mycoplasma mycoides]QVJ96187.1 glycosyl hydrolase [Mycoplasma mycoides subsp. capri]QVJ97081.1 glycosyl hydrolase [Mycoplasma mycoides subsp. capri]QVK00064.1 glycosyl hydrolase [Mycoplasma mycoides subsp. capri]QVK00946.1 glycosyl hydrolase [Mycoplasma mycoides subsp. capri]
MSWNIYVVCHTHWDKEWYFTKQDSDVLLCSNLNQITKILSSNDEYKSFTYDGQVSIIDDYLTYYPENEAQIKKLCEQKKLIVGPWYTQPDFFNTTSESIIRNLLIGINLSKKYNADYLKTAYVPDSFGHNNQMPQIYKSFNLNNFIYWRGIKNSQLKKAGTLHYWQGIDKTKITSYNFYYGYWVLGSKFAYTKLTKDNLKNEAVEFLKNITPILNQLKKVTKNSNNNLLLPLGGDQAPIVELTPEFFKQVNKLSNDNWILTDYDTYFKNIDNNNLKTIKGELKSPSKARIHKTIASQRYDIKQLLKTVEHNLYNVLEPLAIYYKYLTNKYEKQIINNALKLILTSQAHDSIGCCNSDETNLNIYNRLLQANYLIESQITKLIKNLSLNINLKENQVLVFNSNSFYKNNIFKELNIFTSFNNFKIYHNKKAVDFILLDQQYHDDGMIVNLEKQGEISSKTKGFYSSKIIINNLKIDPFKFEILDIVQSDKKQTNSSFNNIKTNRFDIWINDDNTITYLDKITNKKYHNQFMIYAQHDFGDSYDYSPLTETNQIISKLIDVKIVKVEYSSNNNVLIQLKNTYQIPYDTTKTKYINQEFDISLLFTNDPIIKIKINTLNKATQIRWRIISNCDQINNYSYADQCYCEIKRPVELTKDLLVWKKENWVEKPVGIETNESYVYLKSNRSKTGFVTLGTNEYEIINKKEIHLTLFRSIDVLGRNNLLWRPNRASGTSEFSIKTDDARLLYKNLEFNLYWFDINNSTNIAQLANNLITPTCYYQNQKFNNLKKRFDRFLFINDKIDINKIPIYSLIKNLNKNIIIKTIKLSENDDFVIIRCFNNSKTNQQFSLLINNQLVSFNKLNMLEEIKNKDLKTDWLRPYEIGTYSLKLFK